MKRSYFVVILLLAMALLIPGGCATDKDKVSGTGTVKRIELEGAFYGIVSDDGKNYDPVNLKEEFQKDGLRVRFEARIRKDVVTIRMWGTTVEITKIEKLPATTGY